ncbi:hypothetical protein QJQ45_005261 [Haematococcus lacustris]|nr:hypothetical protein QJQ45_005261 [Haematococcus lacustris]
MLDLGEGVSRPASTPPNPAILCTVDEQLAACAEPSSHPEFTLDCQPIHLSLPALEPLHSAGCFSSATEKHASGGEDRLTLSDLDLPPFTFPLTKEACGSASSSAPCSPTLISALTLDHWPADLTSTTSTAVSCKTPATSLEPTPATLRIFRTTLSFSYVQELLESLSHLQQQALQCLSGNAPGAKAAAAGAAMLSRGLARAAQRVRATAHDNPHLLLPLDALFTVREYGWAEVVTLQPGLADEMGFRDAEEHDLATGAAALYHRPAVGQAWSLVSALDLEASSGAGCLPGQPVAVSRPATGVGRSTTSLELVCEQLGGAPAATMLDAAAAAGVALASLPANLAATAPTFPNITNAKNYTNTAETGFQAAVSVAAAAAGLTLMGLSAHLAAVSEAVALAATQLKAFAEEAKTAMLQPSLLPTCLGERAGWAQPSWSSLMPSNLPMAMAPIPLLAAS